MTDTAEIPTPPAGPDNSSPTNSGAAARLATVKAKLEKAAAAANRDISTIKLIAVSKTYDAAAIAPVLDVGHRHFGENRVQEAHGKWPALKAQYPGVELHLIGPLQSNKAADAVALFDCIHTLDRPKIADALAAESVRQSRHLEMFIQVNTGKESQKAGIMPEDAASFLAHCRDVRRLPVVGLMCIPPVDDEPAIHFAFLAKLSRELGLQQISMGMSADFETAIAFGSTNIRVGSAIFGSRG